MSQQPSYFEGLASLGTYIHVQVYMKKYIYIYTCMHTYIHTYVHVHTQACVIACFSDLKTLVTPRSVEAAAVTTA